MKLEIAAKAFARTGHLRLKEWRTIQQKEIAWQRNAALLVKIVVKEKDEIGG